mgnify:CR=1 FL=1
MAENQTDSGEKSEEPTLRKLQKARDEGNVPRSKELPAAAVMISSMALLFLMGGWLVTKMAEQFAAGFQFDRRIIFSELLLPGFFAEQLGLGLLFVVPIFILTAFVAVFGSVATGGFVFSWKAVAPKFNKINPLNGLKRMFGMQAAVELFKSLLKFLLVSGALIWVLYDNINELTQIGKMSLEPALAQAGALIAESAFIVTLTLALIALIDVPFQRYDFFKKQRMTKQEVKDELKDVEGRPEVRAQIRRKQREMANARMIEKVKDADVVITNPEHFAVALNYEPTSDEAPHLLAKGIDSMAHRIRGEANDNGVQIFESPDLARAIYFTTDLDQPIPEDLYYAVAQVIAYVYNLNSAQRGGQALSRLVPTIPESMLFNEDGNPRGSKVS